MPIECFDTWKKSKSGIRPGFERMHYANIAHVRWVGLKTVIRMYGKKIGDRWIESRPSKVLTKIDKEVKIRSDLIINPPEHFPDLKYAGCSLQYIIMLSECLGGANWYKPYIRRPDEFVKKTAVSRNKMDEMLKEFRKQS